MKKTTLKPPTKMLNIPLNFGDGSSVNHVKYGLGICVGFVQGQYWRIQFDSGQVYDFLPSKLFANLK